MKKDVLFILFMVFMLVGGYKIGNIYVDEAGPGEQMVVRINVGNNWNTDLDASSVRLTWLGRYTDRFISRSFDMEGYEERSSVFLVDLPTNIDRGDHLVKATISNDDYSNSKYFWVNVI